MSIACMKRRSSTPCLSEANKRHRLMPSFNNISISSPKLIVSGKKRKLEDIEECFVLIKRLNIRESNIYLVLSEIDIAFNMKPHIHLAPELLMAYCHSGDPRNYFATDIQRVFRGWSTRKQLNDISKNFKNEII